MHRYDCAPCQGASIGAGFIENERSECIGNYPSDSWGVMTVYKFNTLPLYKKEWVFMVPWEKVEKNAGILKKN